MAVKNKRTNVEVRFRFKGRHVSSLLSAILKAILSNVVLSARTLLPTASSPFTFT